MLLIYFLMKDGREGKQYSSAFFDVNFANKKLIMLSQVNFGFLKRLCFICSSIINSVQILYPQ